MAMLMGDRKVRISLLLCCALLGSGIMFVAKYAFAEKFKHLPLSDVGGKSAGAIREPIQAAEPSAAKLRGENGRTSSLQGSAQSRKAADSRYEVSEENNMGIARGDGLTSGAAVAEANRTTGISGTGGPR